jgi:hypothetical protein
MRGGDPVVTDNHAAAIIRRNETEAANVERLADHAPELPDTL